ncbi:MAG: hypothetical protein AB7D28_02070 [Candidatus Berkiella sp.]
MRLFALVGLIFLLTGCIIEPSNRAQRIIVAQPEMVSECALLGEVAGNSKITLLPQGEQLARYRALDQAASLGATHVIWVNQQNQITKNVARARAYYCDPDKVMPRSYQYIDQYLRAHRYPFDEAK